MSRRTYWRIFRLTLLTIIALVLLLPVSLDVDGGTYLDTYQRLKKQYDKLEFELFEIIWWKGKQYGVRPGIICAFIDAESNWKRTARSYAGARGLMQVMPYWWDGPSRDLYKANINVYMGTKILRYYLDKANGNLLLAAKYYNAGYNPYFNGPYILSIVRNISISFPEMSLKEAISF